MTGLLVKDFSLMLQRKRFFIIMIVCGLAMSFSMEGTFIVCWMLLITSLFSLSTISYDEYDNCYPFLMTLPITRKIYAAEKYLFGIICGLAGLIISIVLYAIGLVANGAGLGTLIGELPVICSMFIIPLMVLTFSIPVDLKFGSEKGRTVLILIWGICFAGAFIINKFIGADFLNNIQIPGNMTVAAIAGLVIALVLTGVSLLVSVRIMESKEF